MTSHRSNGSSRKAPRKKPASSPRRSVGLTRVVIPSDFNACRDLQKRILSAVAACGYSPNNQFGIKLALEEAMINAIKHGNKLDSSKKVRVSYKVSPRAIEITVEDEGSGFNRSEVPDPTLEENLCKCSGRGILLIEAYMSKVSFSNKGRRIRMVKQNDEELAKT